MASFRLPLLAAGSVLAVLIGACLSACKPASQDDATTQTATPAGTATQAAPASTHKPATTATEWLCGNVAVSTHFDDESLESITLKTPERQFTLKSMANEDGARFADAAGNEFWSRPGKVSFTQVGQPAVECRKSRG